MSIRPRILPHSPGTNRGGSAQKREGHHELIEHRLFDNAASTWEDSAERARGMLISIDTASNTASLVQAFYPYTNETSPSQGSLELQPNGDYLAGYVLRLQTSDLMLSPLQSLPVDV